MKANTATQSRPANPANVNAAATPSVPGVVDINVSSSKIAELQAQLAAAQASHNAARMETLKNLHTTVGMESAMELIKALKAVDAGLNPFDGTVKNGTRATITEETRTKVKELVTQKKTGEEISALLGISVPSVQNIKKTLGLTRTNGKKK
jgi:hypothetical protein